MKTLHAFALSLACCAPLSAQESLLVGDLEFGGFGGPAVQLTSINDKLGVMIGGMGGATIGHTVIIGGGGFGLINDVAAPKAPAGAPYLDLGYGGLYLQYTHRSDDLVHAAVSVLLGGGSVGYRESPSGGREESEEGVGSDGFFVGEPGLEAELNITTGFRVALCGSWRFVSGVELPGLSSTDISGPNARLMIRFGKF